MPESFEASPSGKEEINNGILWNLYEPSSRFSEISQARSLVGPKIRITTMKITVSSACQIFAEHRPSDLLYLLRPGRVVSNSKDSSVLTGEYEFKYTPHTHATADRIGSTPKPVALPCGR